jgi:CheY-like chemotaxis protein
MDIQMPIKNGYDAATELRAKGFKKPMIALTAHALKGERERCIAAGFTDYLTKPINRAGLITMAETFKPRN